MRYYTESTDCRIVRCLTDDHLWLQGLSFNSSGKKLGVLHIHGLAGNFYENTFIQEVAYVLSDIGCGMLSVSTRGRDYEADFLKQDNPEQRVYEEVRIGAAHEILSDSVLDITAWLDVMEHLGYEKVLLQGHSLGTLKVANYIAAKNADPRIAGCIFLSPADMKGIQIERLGSYEEFLEQLNKAEAMVLQGQGDRYLPGQSFYCRITARSYADKFSGEWDIFRFSEAGGFTVLSSIPVPVLCIYGSVDEAVAQNKVYEACQLMAGVIPDFDYRIITGSGHSYIGYEKELAQTIKNWITHKKLS